MGAERSHILEFCATYLDVDRYRDVALNGLQVEGAEIVQNIATAVSCNHYTIQQAIDSGADTLLVHHGLVLNNTVGPILGPTRERLRLLLTHNLNLIGYHLPLDGHPEAGNNARLCDALGLTFAGQFAEISGMPIGVLGDASSPGSLIDFIGRLMSVTDTEPVVLQGGPETVSRVGIVSGSGYSALEDAVAAGCDVLLTGDVREPTMAFAREHGITVIVAGHEASERLGVQFLADKLVEKYGLNTTFISDPNPV